MTARRAVIAIGGNALILDGQRLVAMPYALDVLYCRIPAAGLHLRVRRRIRI